MDIAKIAAIALSGTLLAVILRQKSPALAALVALAATAVMAGMLLDSFRVIFDGFSALIESGGIDPEYYKSIIKVIGVAYFTEITAGLCRDAGESAIAAKLEIAGRLGVMALTVPIVARLMTVIINALSLL